MGRPFFDDTARRGKRNAKLSNGSPAHPRERPLRPGAPPTHDHDGTALNWSGGGWTSNLDECTVATAYLVMLQGACIPTYLVYIYRAVRRCRAGHRTLLVAFPAAGTAVGSPTTRKNARRRDTHTTPEP